ncbi:bone morphogenetic 15 [Pelobates cultripes]|uniref:Bone morphogenetic 15 n=1 Tax=Pelobates cultripes TaxID=61616 RepID=A0AAD1T5I9_PELCU|nr:bone morphogenetic 15 [Pelobates cultripes]
MPGPPRHLLLLILFISPITLDTGGEALRAVMRSSSLPLIRTLLEYGPQEPHMALRRGLNMQHLRFMMDLYRRSAGSNGRPMRGRHVGAAVRLVRPVNQASFIMDGHWHIQNVTFSLQDVIKAERLVRATVMHPRSTHLSNACLSSKVDILSNAGPSLRTKISTRNPRFVETDLTTYLQPLIEDSKKTFKLELQIICRKVKMQPSNLMTVSQSYIPFLLLYLNHSLQSVAEEKNRSKSSLLLRKTRQAGSIGTKLPKFSSPNLVSKSRCVLRPFWVSFHQLGWDHWIIAPHRYNPGYCKGDCPRILHSGYNSPNHAIIQNFINQVVDGSVPRPSCVPYSYGPISVLMIEPEGKILYKEYENMMAESCTCR